MSFFGAKPKPATKPAPFPALPPVTDAPDGYLRPPWNDPAAAFVCQTCGASVVKAGIELHDAWHEAVITTAELSAVRKKMTY